MAAIEDSLVAALAGPVAERRFRGDWNWVGGSRDYEGVAEVAYRLTDDVDGYLGELRVRAEDLVDIHWGDIELLASELLERRVLSGAAVRRLLRERRDPRL